MAESVRAARIGDLAAGCASPHLRARLADQARAEVERWRADYKETRPHSSLGDVPPAQYVANPIEWRG